MIKKLSAFTTFIILTMFAAINVSSAESIENLCLKKNSELRCQDLNYALTEQEKNAFLTNNAKSVCSKCPLNSNYYTCAIKQKASAKRSTIVPKKSDAISGCVEFPSCYDLGYRFQKDASNIIKITTSYHCSACPFDGNWWACANKYGLLEPN